MKEIEKAGFPLRLYDREELRHYPETESFLSLRRRLFTLPRPTEDDGYYLERNTHIFLDGRWDFLPINGTGDWKRDDDDEWMDWSFPGLGEAQICSGREMEIVFSALRARGCTEILVADIEEEPEDAVAFPPYWDAFRAACMLHYPTYSLDIPHLAFDVTGEWGIYSAETRFAVVGGVPEFIADIVDRRGGIEEVRRKTDIYWSHIVKQQEEQEEWMLPPEPFYYARAFARRIYRMCRWDNCPV